MVTKTLDRTHSLTVVDSWFKTFKTWWDKKTPPTANEFGKCISSHFELINNGRSVLRGLDNFLERLKKFQKKYTDFRISDYLEEPIINGDHGVVYYKLSLTTQNREHKEIFIMARFTIQDDKISRWVEVTAERDSSRWDA